MQSNAYGSGTEYAPNPSQAWLFYTSFGRQTFGVKGTALYALAVRPADVSATAPEPQTLAQTLALALLALGAAVAAARRRAT